MVFGTEGVNKCVATVVFTRLDVTDVWNNELFALPTPLLIFPANHSIFWMTNLER